LYLIVFLLLATCNGLGWPDERRMSRDEPFIEHSRLYGDYSNLPNDSGFQ